MPLEPGNSPDVVSRNISELTHHGSHPRSHEQIVAIALSNARAHPHDARGGGIGMTHADPLGNLAHETPVKGMGGVGGMGGIGGKSAVMSGSQATPWWTRSAARGMDHPAGAMHFQMGGMSPSQESPWWERSAARQADIPFHGGGLINSGVAGRTDRIPMVVGASAHVLPADTLSGAGQDSTLAGANILKAAMASGPWGTTLPHEVRGHGPPAAPHVPASVLANDSKGGRTSEHAKTTQVLVAGGEMVVPPEIVEDIGQRGLAQGMGKKGESAMDLGHRLLDEMIHRIRKFHIDWLKNAPPPKRKHGGAIGVSVL